MVVERVVRKGKEASKNGYLAHQEDPGGGKVL